MRCGMTRIEVVDEVPMDSTGASTPAEPNDEIIARPGRYYRWVRYLISIGLLMGYGSWFIKDGFFTWPAALKAAQELEKQGKHAEVKPESQTAIDINRAIGVTMPPLGLAMLIWTLYNSRGQYRLSGHTLYVPGHPPVPLESILKMDKTLWDKKGIAYIEYLPAPAKETTDRTTAPRTLKLDDFVYDQTHTDAIVERFEQIIAPPEDEATTTETEHDVTTEDEPAA